MKNRKPTTLLREIGIGLILSILAAASMTIALAFFPAAHVVRGVIAAVTFGYACLTLARSSERIGRIVTMAAWLLALGLAWWSGIGLAGFVAIHIIMLWLVRALYVYARPIEAGIDLGLTVVAIGFASWAALRTDSLLLATWSFFLIQAFHVYVPALARRCVEPKATAADWDDPNRRFADASKAADAALRRIAGLG